jgi:hypothetical protein
VCWRCAAMAAVGNDVKCDNARCATWLAVVRAVHRVMTRSDGGCCFRLVVLRRYGRRRAQRVDEMQHTTAVDLAASSRQISPCIWEHLLTFQRLGSDMMPWRRLGSTFCSLPSGKPEGSLSCGIEGKNYCLSDHGTALSFSAAPNHAVPYLTEARTAYIRLSPQLRLARRMAFPHTIAASRTAVHPIVVRSATSVPRN